MNPDTKALRKLKRKYSKNPDDRGVALVKRLLLSYLPGWLVIWVLRKYFVKSDYKAARESIKFFQLSSTAYSAGKARKAQRLLLIALRLLGDGLPKSYIFLLHSVIVATLQNPTKRSLISKSILLGTKEIPVETLDASHWYQLSRGLFSLGYFRAAWVARENSIDLSISEALAPDANLTTTQRAIEAHLERREFDLASRILKNSAEKYKQKLHAEYKIFLSLVHKKFHETNIDLSDSSFDQEGYGHLIKDRSVAIVGPAKFHGNYGNKIDSCDTVIRIKSPGVRRLPAKELYGERCDINYYGGNEIQSLIDSRDEVLVEDCLNPPMITLSWDYKLKTDNNFIIYNLDFTGPLYRTTSTAGVRTLFSMLCLRPKKMLVFGFDFYASEKQYSDDMMRFLDRKAQELGHSLPIAKSMVGFESAYRCTGLVHHDPVSNFCFAQNLHKAGLFEIEPYGKSILELTPYQYVERLEEMLGDW